MQVIYYFYFKFNQKLNNYYFIESIFKTQVTNQYDKKLACTCDTLCNFLRFTMNSFGGKINDTFLDFTYDPF